MENVHNNILRVNMSCACPDEAADICRMVKSRIVRTLRKIGIHLVDSRHFPKGDIFSDLIPVCLPVPQLPSEKGVYSK